MLVELIILVSKVFHIFAITCESYSGSASGNYKVTTNVTGPGDSCCAVSAWAGSFYGVTYKPYFAQTEMCCKGMSYFVGSTQYQLSTVGKGNTCCNGLAYDSTINICCSEGNSNNAGPGDTCCGTNPYYKDKQKCCSTWLSAINLEVFTVADGCCKFGQAPYNKSFQVCCNEWKIGNGDSCCNFNGEENGNEPPDEPYYKGEKCCVKGKLQNYGCLNRSYINQFNMNLSLFLFAFLLYSYI